MTRKTQIILIIIFPVLIFACILLIQNYSEEEFDLKILWGGFIGALLSAWLTVFILIIQLRPSKKIRERMNWDLTTINFNSSFSILNMVGFEDLTTTVFEFNEASNYKNSMIEYVDNSNKVFLQTDVNTLASCIDSTDDKSIDALKREFSSIQVQWSDFIQKYREYLLLEKVDLSFSIKDDIQNILFSLNVISKLRSNRLSKRLILNLAYSIRDFTQDIASFNSTPKWGKWEKIKKSASECWKQYKVELEKIK